MRCRYKSRKLRTKSGLISKVKKTSEINRLSGGGRGIRTPGTVARTTVFETAPFNHSGIPPRVEVLGRKAACI
jgi:hypothetical protein